MKPHLMELQRLAAEMQAELEGELAEREQMGEHIYPEHVAEIDGLGRVRAFIGELLGNG